MHILCKNSKIVFKQQFPVFQDKLHYVLRNISRRCKTCSEAEGCDFKTLLLKNASASGGEEWTVHFVVDAGFLCGEAPVTAVVLRGTIRGIWCIKCHVIRDGRYQYVASIYFRYCCQYIFKNSCNAKDSMLKEREIVSNQMSLIGSMCKKSSVTVRKVLPHLQGMHSV
jgi:hypothetical protein